MKDLNAARWATLSPHLDELLVLSPHEQSRKLDLLTSTDPELSSQLREMLATRAAVSFVSFLGGVANESLLGPNVAAGEVMGSWTLIDVIGQGDMGSVWRARRSDGRFEGEAYAKDGKLVVNGNEIAVFACKDPAEINWAGCEIGRAHV